MVERIKEAGQKLDYADKRFFSSKTTAVSFGQLALAGIQLWSGEYSEAAENILFGLGLVTVRRAVGNSGPL